MASTRRRRMPAAQRREVILAAAEATFAEQRLPRRVAGRGGPRRRGLQGAHLRALRVQARPARLAARGPRGRDLRAASRRPPTAAGAGRSGCATGIDAFLGFVEAHREAWRALFRDAADPEVGALVTGLQAQATAVIARLLAADPDAPAHLAPGTTDHDVRVEIHAQLLSGAVQSLATWWHDHQDIPRATLVDRAMEFVWHGAAPGEAAPLPAVRRLRRPALHPRAAPPSASAPPRSAPPRADAREGIRAGAQNACRMVVLGIDPGLANTGFGVVAAALGPARRARRRRHHDPRRRRARAAPRRPAPARARPARHPRARRRRARGPLLRPERLDRVRGRAGPRRRARRGRRARASRARTTRPSRSRARCAAAGAPPKEQVQRMVQTLLRAARAAAARPRGRRARRRHLPRQPRPADAARSTCRRPPGDRARGRRGRRPPAGPRRRSRPRAGSATACRCRARRSGTSRPSGARSRCTPTSSSATTRCSSTASPPRRSATSSSCCSACSPSGRRSRSRVLGGGTPRDLVRALAAGDVARLQAVPGIGKRTAERIVVELREKVGRRARGRRRADHGDARGR